MPYVTLLIETLLLSIFNSLDTGCTCNKRMSKSRKLH